MKLKDLMRIATNDEALYLLKEINEIDKCINAKSFTMYEETIKMKQVFEMLRRIKEIIKED